MRGARKGQKIAPPQHGQACAGARVSAATSATAKRQRDRRPGVLDLGETREIEHPQPDDHRPGAGDQCRPDLADRFPERVGLDRPRPSSSQYRAIRNRQ